METKIIKCNNSSYGNCISEFQDERYGKNMRVFNPAFAKGSKPRRYRCTICGHEQDS